MVLCPSVFPVNQFQNGHRASKQDTRATHKTREQTLNLRAFRQQVDFSKRGVSFLLPHLGPQDAVHKKSSASLARLETEKCCALVLQQAPAKKLLAMPPSQEPHGEPHGQNQAAKNRGLQWRRQVRAELADKKESTQGIAQHRRCAEDHGGVL